jgi:hypothetical protein
MIQNFSLFFGMGTVLWILINKNKKKGGAQKCKPTYNQVCKTKNLWDNKCDLQKSIKENQDITNQAYTCKVQRENVTTCRKKNKLKTDQGHKGAIIKMHKKVENCFTVLQKQYKIKSKKK